MLAIPNPSASTKGNCQPGTFLSEAFTRFGQRLEASMEARIKRGRLLREILKQDRLRPLSSLFQLAWLTAFNADFFNQADLNQIPALLSRIEQGVHTTELTLDSADNEWQLALGEWLAIDTEQGA